MNRKNTQTLNNNLWTRKVLSHELFYGVVPCRIEPMKLTEQKTARRQL